MLDETAIILSALSIVGNICMGSFYFYREKLKQQANSAVEITTSRSESNLQPIQIIVDNPDSPSNTPSSSNPSHIRTKMSFKFQDSNLLEKSTHTVMFQNGGSKESGLEKLLGNAIGITSKDHSNDRNIHNSDASDDNDFKVNKFLGFAENILKASNPPTPSGSPVMTRSKKTTIDASTNTLVADDLENALIAHQEEIKIIGNGFDEFTEQYTDI